ncbi:MAG TPA: hypothetical protein VFO67_02165 [Gemmatimonadales bacterium]|nr:hypothetical protein [Gemmatimonadales bacterium]
MRILSLPRAQFLAVGAILLGITAHRSATTSAVYNSEEHKWIADLAMARVNQRSATFPALTGFEDFPQTRARYQNAKELAIGIRENGKAGYDSTEHDVQDNSYWTNYGQRDGNFKFHIPDVAEITSTRTLWVPAWDGTQDARFTFGELVALYGDYRRTVSCAAANPARCYLTQADSAAYRGIGGDRAKGRIFFEYGTDCFGPLDCGYEPPDIPVRTYLAFIGSGLWPPFGTLGNTVSNTAWPEEWLDAGWWGDEMMRIANVNDWHWQQAAVAWYVGMHRMALKYALLARTDSRYWVKALHHEASALHSLTDLFAYGHVIVSRDRTSWEIMGDNSLRSVAAYAWMENVITMGGGNRDQGGGKVSVGATLPPLQTSDAARRDLMESYRSGWGLIANSEHTYHDSYNAAGGTVMNMKRQTFKIFGDYKMRNNTALTKSIIQETVRASVQSLFDAYEANPPLDQLVGNGSSAFDALLNIPVYVADSAGSYAGMWTSYAAAVNQLTGAGFAPDLACVIPLVDGRSAPPSSRSSVCSTPSTMTNEAVVSELLQRDGSLGKGDQQGLDTQGNANGSYDAGDFLAWVRRTGATP